MRYQTSEERRAEAADLTLGEAAKELSLHIDTIRGLVREGAIQAYQVNPAARRPSYRVTPDALQAYRQQGMRASAPAAVSMSGAEMLDYWEKEGALGARDYDLESPEYARRLRSDAEKRS
jgi:excisionase family DNA binding protein